MLDKAVGGRVPLIHITTNDTVYLRQILDDLLGTQTYPLELPVGLDQKALDVMIKGRIYFTSSSTKKFVKLYHFCKKNDIVVIFVNTEKSVVHFDAGNLMPTKSSVSKFISAILKVKGDDLDALLSTFVGMTLKEVDELIRITQYDFGSVTPRTVLRARRKYKSLEGISQVSTELEYYKEDRVLVGWLEENATFFLKPIHQSLTPRGLLFDGGAGTGKTMASKFIANYLQLPLYRLDVAGLKGKYVGESEANLTSALKQLDELEPCVVIIDEVEKIFQSQSDSGVTSSLLSQMLWWLQEHHSRVLTIMTTNNQDILPKELYREGRIDKTLRFDGIELIEDAKEFTVGIFTSMIESLFEGYTDEQIEISVTKLSDVIADLYEYKDKVTQAELTQLAYSQVKWFSIN